MKKITIIIGIAILIAITSFFFFNENVKTTGQVITDIDTNPSVEFTVNAFRFGYSPNIINIKQGDVVKISINNTDTPHGIRIPDLGLSGKETIEFIAERTGEYIWYCFIPCGSGHKEMQGKILIE